MYRHIYYTLLVIMLLTGAARAQDQDIEERVNALYNQAETAQEHGELLKAIDLYQQVIKLAPDIFQPKYQCAVACLATGKPELAEEAIALLKEVTQIKPDFARAHATLGNALARNGDAAGAETELRRALELDDKLAQRALLADLLVARRAYREAEVELKILLAQGKNEWRNYLLLGLAQKGEGQWENALASFNKAVELKPDEAEAHYRRGQLYAQEKNYPMAIADLKLAYQGSNNNPEIGCALAESLLDSGDKKAAGELAQTLLANVKEPDTRDAVTSLLARAGANTAAIEQLEKQLAEQPKNVSYLTRLGELYLEISPVRSAEYWQRAYDIEPGIKNEQGLASALLKAQRFEDAIHHFNAVLAQNANYYEAHAGLGLAYFKLQQFAPSAEQFIWVVRNRPDNVIGLYFLGICFDRLGDLQQAYDAYQLFLQRADAKVNKLEIEKVQLRLPSLERQLERSGGKKKKK